MDRRRHFQNPATFYTEDMKSEGTKNKNFVKSISVVDFTKAEFLLKNWNSVTVQCGNCRNSLTLFSQKFRESNGFTKEITKLLLNS